MFIIVARTYLNLLSANPTLAQQYLDQAAPWGDAMDIRRLFPADEVTDLVAPLVGGELVPRTFNEAEDWARTARLTVVEDLLRERVPLLHSHGVRGILRQALTGPRTPYPHREAEAKRGFYMDRAKRKEWVLTIRGGKLYDRSGESLTGRVQYVLSPDGTLYGKYYRPGQKESRERNEYHTRYLAGFPIRVGGWLQVKSNRIIKVGNDSGHYKPPASHLLVLLDQLHSEGVPLRDVKLQVTTIKGTVTYASAEQYRVTRRLAGCDRYSPTAPLPSGSRAPAPRTRPTFAVKPPEQKTSSQPKPTVSQPGSSRAPAPRTRPTFAVKPREQKTSSQPKPTVPQPGSTRVPVPRTGTTLTVKPSAQKISSQPKPTVPQPGSTRVPGPRTGPTLALKPSEQKTLSQPKPTVPQPSSTRAPVPRTGPALAVKPSEQKTPSQPKPTVPQPSSTRVPVPRSAAVPPSTRVEPPRTELPPRKPPVPVFRNTNNQPPKDGGKKPEKKPG